MLALIKLLEVILYPVQLPEIFCTYAYNQKQIREKISTAKLNSKEMKVYFPTEFGISMLLFIPMRK